MIVFFIRKKHQFKYTIRIGGLKVIKILWKNEVWENVQDTNSRKTNLKTILGLSTKLKEIGFLEHNFPLS